MTGKCTQCSNETGSISYKPMEEWKIEGPLCSKCYSSKLGKHYPGEHLRVNRLNEND